MSRELIFFPGLGANQDLFIEQRKHFPQAVFPNWQSPEENESLSDYAKRWSKDFSSQSKVLVGMSFGSQVALELAKHLPVEKVIVISGFSSSAQVSRRFRQQVRWGLKFPDFMIRFVAKHILVQLFAKQESLSMEHRDILRGMVEKMDLRFFRWAAEAAAQWDLKTPPNCSIVEVHGEFDAVVPLSDKDKAVDYLIRDANHLIQMTRAKIVNKVIEDEFTR